MSIRRAAYLTGLPAVSYFGWSALRLTRGTSATLAALSHERPSATDWARGSCRFVVILPVLREDRVVATACEQFARAIEAGVPMEIVVATSEWERAQRDDALAELARLVDQDDRRGWRRLADRALSGPGVKALAAALAAGDRMQARAALDRHVRPTTADVAAAVVANLNARLGRTAFRQVHGDREVVTKVDKLNAALSTLPANDAGAPMFVVLYDADSAPDLTAFDAVEMLVAERREQGAPIPAIFQQVSCYCRGLADFRGTSAPFVIADALAQTRWALGFEYPLYRRYSERARSGRLRPLVYCVGHGCFVSLGLLRQIGGFPTVSATDDLALGYLVSALGAEVVPVPALDYCDAAPWPLASARQARFWFSGSARFHRNLRAFRPLLSEAPGRAQWLYLHFDGHSRNAAWAGRGVGWLLPMGLAVKARAWPLASALVAVHLLYVQAGFLQTVGALRRLPGAAERTRLEELDRVDLALAALAASATFLLRSVGPLSAILGAATGRRAAVSKIER